jgi:hypothetical protein
LFSNRAHFTMEKRKGREGGKEEGRKEGWKGVK